MCHSAAFPPISWLPIGDSSSHMHVTLISKFFSMETKYKADLNVFFFLHLKCSQLIGWFPEHISKHYQRVTLCRWLTCALKCEKLPEKKGKKKKKKETQPPTMQFVASVLFCVCRCHQTSPPTHTAIWYCHHCRASLNTKEQTWKGRIKRKQNKMTPKNKTLKKTHTDMQILNHR